jgi:hypothetical protein
LRHLLERRLADRLVHREARSHERRRAATVVRRNVEVDRDDLLVEAPLVTRTRGAQVRLV